MPRYIIPSSDADRLTALKRAITTANQDIAAGNLYVSQETVTALSTFVAEFEPTVLALNQTLSGRSKEIRERQEAINKLMTYVRDFLAVLKRRAYRLNEPAEVLQFYQLSLTGAINYPTRQEDWLGLAAKVIAGDAEAVAAGYAPMVNPSAVELQAVLDAAVKEADEVALADRAYDQAQAAVAALRPQADALIADVMAELRFTQRNLSASSQRRIMVTYGAKYQRLPGEPEDELLPDEVLTEGERET